jgi:peptide/nickel transport system substrate-binding protein
VRNENWDPETDEYRPAYPDKIVMKFGVDSSVIDQRIIRDSGEDQQAASRDAIQPANLAAVFNDDRLKDRRADVLDAYSYYYAVNMNKLPNLKHRQAIAAALDRAQLIQVAGGKFAGETADGVIKPNLPADYAESGMWTDLLGAEIPDTGDPEYAKQLIEESGEPMPPVRFDYSQTPEHDKEAAAAVTSLEKAGIKVTPNPIEPGQYYSIVFDPEKAGELMWSGWGPDWPNASTVIPELFSQEGGFNLSQVKDDEFDARVLDAKTDTDRDSQSAKWKELNKEAMQQVWAIPTLFARTQTMAGSKVRSASGEDGNVYVWAPYSSWSYADLYVVP